MAVLAVNVHGKTLELAVSSGSAAASFPLAGSYQEVVTQQILPWLERINCPAESLQFVVTSGELPSKSPSGIHLLTDSLASQVAGDGPKLARQLSLPLQLPVYLIDPTLDECHPYAYVTGTPDLRRRCAAQHFLLKYLARQEEKRLGLADNRGRFIVGHLAEVNQLGAVVGDSVVDCLTSADEGPFALTESGGLPFDSVLDLCQESQNREEVYQILISNGGLRGYLGLESLDDLYSGDSEEKALVREALVYQIAKEIGGLAAVLQGQIDAVVLGGELVRYPEFTAELQRRIQFLAPIAWYPGNQGLQALLEGARRILEQEPIVNVS